MWNGVMRGICDVMGGVVGRGPRGGGGRSWLGARTTAVVVLVFEEFEVVNYGAVAECFQSPSARSVGPDASISRCEVDHRLRGAAPLQEAFEYRLRSDVISDQAVLLRGDGTHGAKGDLVRMIVGGRLWNVTHRCYRLEGYQLVVRGVVEDFHQVAAGFLQCIEVRLGRFRRCVGPRRGVGTVRSVVLGGCAVGGAELGHGSVSWMSSGVGGR